ncbi:MAG TPA: choice-of-anchor D domain-containing protein, partial [Candidatus Kapabacteria bacterium]|nr:choice-of-anchor D domain-containing protein [Candidatus Kapabacteria bacterium]
GTHGRSVWQIPLVDDETGISLPAQRTVWTIGDSASIQWHGFGAQVTLDLSFDGGTTWQSLASGVAASSYDLSNVVYPASENALVRVSDGSNTLVSPIFSIVQQKFGDQLTTVGELPLYLYDLAYDKDDNVLWATTYDQSGKIYKIDPDKGTQLGSVKVAVNSPFTMAGLTGIKYDSKTKHLFLQQVLNTSDPYAWQSSIYEVDTSGTIINTWPSPAEYGTGIYITGDTILVADRMTQQVKMATFQDMNFNDFNPLLDFSATRGAVYGARALTYDPKLGQYLLAYTDFEGTRQSATFNGSDILFLDPNQGGIEVNSVPVMDGESTANIRGLEYDPRGSGNTAWLTILNTSNSSKIVKIALSDGPTGAPAALFTTQPTPLAFGTLDTGKTMTIHVQIHNSGTASGTIKQLSISPNASAYSLGAISLPATLASGDSDGVDVTFAPHSVGAQDASLMLTNGGDSSQVSFPITGYATFNGAGVEANSISSAWSLEISPNPARDFADLTVTAAKADVADVRIFDVTGREVRREALGMLSVGEHETELSTAGLPSGMYFVRITGNNGEVCAARLAIER